MKLNSNKENIAAAASTVYNVLLSFSKSDSVPPIPQVSDWKSVDNGFECTISNMIKCRMQLVEQVPYSRIVYQISTDKGINASACGLIEDNGGQCSLQLTAEADVPLFVQPMVKGPLQQVLNRAILKIKEIAEKI